MNRSEYRDQWRLIRRKANSAYPLNPRRNAAQESLWMRETDGDTDRILLFSAFLQAARIFQDVRQYKGIMPPPRRLPLP